MSRNGSSVAPTQEAATTTAFLHRSDLSRIETLYARYRAILLHVAAGTLCGSFLPTIADRAAGLVDDVRAAAADSRGDLREPLGLALRAVQDLARWVDAVQQGDEPSATDIADAAASSHRALRRQMWALTGGRDCAPCGADGLGGGPGKQRRARGKG